MEVMKISVCHSLLNVIPLHEKITALENLLGVWITMHNIRGIWSVHRREAQLPGRRCHKCPFCGKERFTSRKAKSTVPGTV